VKTSREIAAASADLHNTSNSTQPPPDKVRRARARIPGDASRRFLEVVGNGGHSGEGDANELLTSVLLDASELLQSPRVTLMLYNAEDRTVEILDIGTPAFPGRIVHLGEGVAGRVIASGQPLVVEHYERWPGKISGEVDGPEIVSAVAVPLRHGSTPIGAMTAHSTDPDRRFTDGDAHVLEVFADVAMLALSHFSMHDELRTLNSRLERRVRERTKALQRSSHEIFRKNEQLEELILGVERTQDDERRRIAQDIHDSVMQTLSGAIFELKAAETSAGTSPVAPRLTTIRDLLHQLESELRGVIQDLQPAELEPGGLVRAIESEAVRLQSRYAIQTSVQTFGRHRAVPTGVEVAVLRIAKEALGNIQRHASARNAVIELHLLKNEVRLRVRDDGTGFDLDCCTDTRSHMGISGMRRRAEARGGSFVLDSTIGGGTTIMAALPTATQP
jgi:signal transduction histidine kinase